MSKLTNLEKAELRLLFQSLRKISKAFDKSSDSVCDFIFGEVKALAPEGEEETLKKFMEYCHVSHSELDAIFTKLDLIEQHFLSL